jgi:uncharacterized protein with FMN-binding domain
MKKVALSLAVLAASGAYVWQQSHAVPADDLLNAGTTTPLPAAPAPVVAPASVTIPEADKPRLVHTSSITPDAVVPTLSAFAVAEAAPPRAADRPRITRDTQPVATPAALTVAAGPSGLADGTYTGPAVDAYYGLVQVQAIVQSGKLSAIKILRYPSDRRTSVAINRQALPMLRDEVIAAQSARVDIISGATLTSEAFIESLSRALQQATTT